MYIKGKKAHDFLARYYNCHQVDLYDCYARPSRAKVIAWKDCINMCEHMNGRGLTIISYNSQTFTSAFEYTHPDTGVLMCHVETYANSYDMEM